jgi:hypothetical protein
VITTAQQYDVDAPEGAQQNSSYWSKKDLRYIAGILLIIAVIFTPAYFGFLEQRDKQVCGNNMHAIYNAMMQYAEQNDSRLPPMYEIGGNGAPAISSGKPSVWASQLVPFMNPRANFFCPASKHDERMAANGHDGRVEKDFELTYGMYLPMSAFPYLLVANPSNTALIVETSNFGSQGSFNPMPFTDASGKLVPFDAFMVGYDNSNVELTPEAKRVTRLAFRGQGQGGHARHSKGLHIFHIDGHKEFITPGADKIKNIYPEVEGPWRVK